MFETTQEVRDRLRSLFADYDDGSGKMNLEQLTTALLENGYKLSDGDIKNMFASVNFDTGDKITGDRFVDVVGALPVAIHNAAGLRLVLTQFDSKENGVIYKEDLQEVYNTIEYMVKEEHRQRIGRMATTQQSVELNIEDFVTECFPS